MKSNESHRLLLRFNICLGSSRLLTLLGRRAGRAIACQGKFSESEGIDDPRVTLDGQILVGSCVGCFYPVQMSPILILQVTYKSLWLLVFRSSQATHWPRAELPWGVTITFVVIVVSYPWIIPWALLFGPH